MYGKRKKSYKGRLFCIPRVCLFQIRVKYWEESDRSIKGKEKVNTRGCETRESEKRSEFEGKESQTSQTLHLSIFEKVKVLVFFLKFIILCFIFNLSSKLNF